MHARVLSCSVARTAIKVTADANEVVARAEHDAVDRAALVNLPDLAHVGRLREPKVAGPVVHLLRPRPPLARLPMSMRKEGGAF